MVVVILHQTLPKILLFSAANLLTNYTALGIFGKTNIDWDWTNKVKVRIMGHHSPIRQRVTYRRTTMGIGYDACNSSTRSGIGSLHQLQINSWVIGFFMDGGNAQVPIVIGALGDENPQSGYGSEGGTNRI